MRAVTVQPGSAGTVRLDDVPDPDVAHGSVVVEALAVGICGTDREIADGRYGTAPPGHDRLVLGHESLGRVVDPGPVSGWDPGDLVVGIVRRPDPVPCASCAVGEWDMCRNGRYTERGITGRDGFLAERWRTEPEFAVRLDPSLDRVGVLLEPMTVVAKAWEVATAIGGRAYWEPDTVLVTGAGPIGLLAALLGRRRGLDVHVLDRVEDGAKPELVRALGATYHAGDVAGTGLAPDIVIECTGAVSVVLAAVDATAPGGVVCLAGLSGRESTVGLSGALADEIVLANKAVAGTVNANRRHYHKAARALARADHGWLEHLITRRVAPDDITAALTPQDDDIKVVVDLG